MAELTKKPENLGRRGRFLLVVDSDANNLFYTAMLLQRFDYQISMAGTATDALALLRVAVPSLVITALDLKDMNGLELIQQLKQDPLTADVPFLALIKQGDLLGETRSHDLGAVDCLYQPVSPELLYRAVQAATEKIPRASIRIRTLLPVKINAMPVDDSGSTYTLELSERGMFVRTTKPAALNTRLSVQVDLNGPVIAADAVVLYSYQTAGGPYREPGMGLAFVQIAPRDQELIRQFIRDEIMRGIVPENV